MLTSALKRGADLLGGTARSVQRAVSVSQRPATQKAHLTGIRQRAAVDARLLTLNKLLQLQRAVGNLAVRRILDQSAAPAPSQVDGVAASNYVAYKLSIDARGKTAGRTDMAPFAFRAAIEVPLARANDFLSQSEIGANAELVGNQ